MSDTSTHTDDGEREELERQFREYFPFMGRPSEGRVVLQTSSLFDFILGRDKAQRQALDLKAEMRGRVDEWLRLDKVVGFTKKRHKAVYKLQLPLAYVETRTKELKDALHQLTMDKQRNG